MGLLPNRTQYTKVRPWGKGGGAWGYTQSHGRGPEGASHEGAGPRALKVVYDPEIPVNIVDLGLVYDVEVHENGVVDVTMTLTAIGCPAQDVVKADAEMAVMRLPGVQGVNVEFVWTPPWTPARMTEEGKRMMRMFGFNV